MGQRHLVADASDGFCSGEGVSFLEASDLSFLVCSNNDDLVHSLVDAGFEEQRDIVDNNGIGILARSLSRQPGLFARNARVNDSFELAQLGLVGEDDGAQRMTIERAIRVEDGLAERVHDLSPCRLAGFDDFSRKLVGINDNCAASLEHPCHRTLASGDSTCEPNQDHGGEAYHAGFTLTRNPVDRPPCAPV